jgi:hypothetical protein
MGWRWSHGRWRHARGSHSTGDRGLGSDLRGALERITGIAHRYPIGDRCAGHWPSSLLDGVRRFVRQQPLPRSRSRIVGTCAEEHIGAGRKGHRIHRPRQPVGLAVAVHPQVRYVTAHHWCQLLLHLGRERRAPLRSGLNPGGKIGRHARSPAVRHLRWGRGAALAGTLALDHALDELVALRPLQV